MDMANEGIVAEVVAVAVAVVVNCGNSGMILAVPASSSCSMTSALNKASACACHSGNLLSWFVLLWLLLLSRLAVLLFLEGLTTG